MSGLRVLSHLGPVPALDAVPGVEVVPIPRGGPLDESVRGDVLLTLMTGGDDLPDLLGRGVQWVHAVGTGVDAFPVELLRGRPLTCSRGANAVYVAEWAFAQMLCVEKELPGAWVTAPPDAWGDVRLGTLSGRTLALVGLGSIGTALATRAQAFGMSVRAMRRSAAPSPVPGVELVHDVDALVDGADHVVLAAPATASTRGMVDAAFLAAMRPGAHLVNVARADLVDEDALRAALDRGHLRAASVDVCRPEPLPAGHWFYDHPRVRFSPHVSWSGPGVWEATLGMFADNVVRRLAGEPLLGVVDIEEGY